MSDDSVQCCRECRSVHLRIRSLRGSHSTLDAGEGRYRCADCGATFDEPDERERATAGDGLNGLAKQLDELEVGHDPVGVQGGAD